jgi:hypothetical protein
MVYLGYGHLDSKLIRLGPTYLLATYLPTHSCATYLYLHTYVGQKWWKTYMGNYMEPT